MAVGVGGGEGVRDGACVGNDDGVKAGVGGTVCVAVGIEGDGAAWEVQAARTNPGNSIQKIPRMRRIVPRLHYD